MDSLEQSEQYTAEQDGEVEFTDLDPLCDAGSQQSSWVAFRVPDWQRSPHQLRYRKLWRLTSTPAALLLLVILLSLNHVSSSLIVKNFRMALFPPPALSSVAALPAPLPRQDGIACLTDAAWSPDNHFIAVLGYQDCPRDSYMAGLVNLYDARSKHLISQVKPGDAILRALNSSLSPSTRQAVEKILADGPVGESPPRPLSCAGRLMAHTCFSQALHGVSCPSGAHSMTPLERERTHRARETTAGLARGTPGVIY